ncbi:MAG: HAD family hydrolase [Gammaproteobacteria bacterium]|nr:MAG: HAD family hydrolase [Gammaproteobacteria bacterium]
MSTLMKIQLVALDVDGVLTDGRVTYTSAGEELKSFNIKDGLGLKLLRDAGIELAIITGRVSPMVERRARELGIAHLIQGREDKIVALQALCNDLNVNREQVAYMGDDLPDLAAIEWAALGAAPADGHPLVRAHADWVASRNGGQGAVRELAEHILRAQGRLADTLAAYRLQKDGDNA